MELLQWSVNKTRTVNEYISNKELAEELIKPTIRKFEKIQIH